MGGDVFLEFGFLHILFNEPDEVAMVDFLTVLGEEEYLLAGVPGKRGSSVFNILLHIITGELPDGDDSIFGILAFNYSEVAIKVIYIIDGECPQF